MKATSFVKRLTGFLELVRDSIESSRNYILTFSKKGSKIQYCENYASRDSISVLMPIAHT
jgi:hypothetical protein